MSNDIVELISVQQACKAMLSLKQECIHPETQQPYIISASGGENNSPENLAVRLRAFMHSLLLSDSYTV